jgi:hypothetical protein
MEIGQLYQFVLVLVLVGIVLGVGILIVDKLASASGVTASAALSLNDTRDALGTISSDWLGIIVIVAMCAILLVLVIRSFATGMGGGRR